MAKKRDRLENRLGLKVGMGGRGRSELLFVFWGADAEADGRTAGFGNDASMAFTAASAQSCVGRKLREQEAQEAKQN